MGATTLSDLDAWIGRTRSVEDAVTLPAVRRIAAMLDLPDAGFAAGTPLPPHWYAMFFPELGPQAELGPDGHPRRGDFLPPVPLPRRMLAGRRVRLPGALRVGDTATRRSEVVAIAPKTGRSGRMVFVTVRHTVAVAGRTLVVEEQDVVYREAAPPGPAAATPPAPAPAAAAWSEPVTPDPVLLFRYSAITFNGHRIHYDADYARAAEGYPAPVMNGGLTILLLLEAARRRGLAPLAGFAARTVRPIFLGGAVTLAGTAAADGRATVWALDAAGAPAMTVDLELAA